MPIGARSAAWLEKHIREGRPQLVSEPDDFTVFLTANGEPFSRDHLTFAVRERISAAKLGKGGACHLFRHTRVTLMHENGADIRHIQAILGHEDIKTTQIYAGGNPRLASDPRSHASGRGAGNHPGGTYGSRAGGLAGSAGSRGRGR